MRHLATFDNAWRLAATMAELHDHDYVVLATCDPDQPYIVEEEEGQPHVIALITGDTEFARQWMAQRRPRHVPLDLPEDWPEDDFVANDNFDPDTACLAGDPLASPDGWA